MEPHQEDLRLSFESKMSNMNQLPVSGWRYIHVYCRVSIAQGEAPFKHYMLRTKKCGSLYLREGTKWSVRT